MELRQKPLEPLPSAPWSLWLEFSFWAQSMAQKRSRSSTLVSGLWAGWPPSLIAGLIPLIAKQNFLLSLLMWGPALSCWMVMVCPQSPASHFSFDHRYNLWQQHFPNRFLVAGYPFHSYVPFGLLLLFLFAGTWWANGQIPSLLPHMQLHLVSKQEQATAARHITVMIYFLCWTKSNGSSSSGIK